jgi:hypothetical protein
MAQQVVLGDVWPVLAKDERTTPANMTLNTLFWRLYYMKTTYPFLLRFFNVLYWDPTAPPLSTGTERAVVVKKKQRHKIKDN